MFRSITILCLLAISFQTSWGQTLQDDLQSRYRSFNRAIQRRDTHFFETYLSPTFTADLPNQTSADRASSIKGFTDLMNAVQSSDWTFKLSDMSVASRGVEVTANGHLTAAAIGPDKKKHRLDLRGVTRDRWVLQNNTWMLDHVTFLKLNGTIDGKSAPVPGLPSSLP